MKKLIFGILLLASGSLWALPGGGPPDGKWWKRPRISREVGLSPEQVDRLEKIFLRTRPTLIDLRADLEKKQTVLQSLLENPRVDSEEASRRIDEVEKARAQLAKKRAMMLLEFRQVLTPDQWQKLRDLRDVLRERRQERLRRPRAGDASDD